MFTNRFSKRDKFLKGPIKKELCMSTLVTEDILFIAYVRRPVSQTRGAVLVQFSSPVPVSMTRRSMLACRTISKPHPVFSSTMDFELTSILYSIPVERRKKILQCHFNRSACLLGKPSDVMHGGGATRVLGNTRTCVCFAPLPNFSLSTVFLRIYPNIMRVCVCRRSHSVLPKTPPIFLI